MQNYREQRTEPCGLILRRRWDDCKIRKKLGIQLHNHSVAMINKEAICCNLLKATILFQDIFIVDMK